MLEPVKGQGVKDLNGPSVAFDADDPAGPQAVFKGGPGHLAAKGF
jgi:hypothetical protein